MLWADYPNIYGVDKYESNQQRENLEYEFARK